jgi:predicted O-methyltransferase YrrM
VEIGTFTGYATLCLWEGLDKEGMIYTYEINEETKWLYDKYVTPRAGDQINYKLGDALDHIDDIPTEIDLAWIDADKKQNPDFYEKVLAKTRKGGIIMIDNTLWSGKVLEKNKDHITQSIVDFSNALIQDDRINCIMLPIRDGVTMVIKK